MRVLTVRRQHLSSLDLGRSFARPASFLVPLNIDGEAFRFDQGVVRRVGGWPGTLRVPPRSSIPGSWHGVCSLAGMKYIESRRGDIEASGVAGSHGWGEADGLARGYLVLIVEDDPDLRWAIHEVLSMRGIEAYSAQDGTSALELSRKREYDLVITDLCLPGTNGIAVSRSLRSAAHPPDVILITAYPEWYTGIDLGEVTEVMRKPLDLGVLADRVERLAAAKTRREWTGVVGVR